MPLIYLKPSLRFWPLISISHCLNDNLYSEISCIISRISYLLNDVARNDEMIFELGGKTNDKINQELYSEELDWSSI